MQPTTPAIDVQVRIDGELDLDATLHSGQAFRWTRQPDGSHVGFIRNQPARIRLAGKILHVTAPGLSPHDVRHYFRLDRSHDDFVMAVPRDAALAAALARFPGLRLLRQDPWEMLVSFVVSQNSNEAKIRRTIEGICKLSGDPVATDEGTASRFPTPARLAALSLAQLRSTGMGYRAPYVHGVAQEVATGRLEPDLLGESPYEEAFERLIRLHGVGAKVADCILLYGCDHQTAFPSDVWVRRFIRESYLRRQKDPSHEKIRAFALRHFGPHAGYAQHYLFHYRRGVGTLASKTS